MDLVARLRFLEMQLGALSALSTLHLGPFDGCLFVSQDLGALEGPQNEFVAGGLGNSGPREGICAWPACWRRREV
jgi:hypothetical protein